jgi:hypothetical protein
MPRIATSQSTKLVLSTGAELEVPGSIETIEKLLQDAARSSPGTLAWLTDAGGTDRLGVNPAHVVTVTAVTGGPER